MTVNIKKLAITLELLSSSNALNGLPTVMQFMSELAVAQEAATVVFDVNRISKATLLSNVAVVSGALRNEALDRFLYARSDWWADQLLCPSTSPASLLVQAKENLVSDAFRFACEPLPHPKWSSIIVNAKIGQKTMAAVVASEISEVSSILNLTLFQSLATTVLQGYAQNRSRDVSKLVTDREKECLLWSARGKTSVDIAEITGLSEHTVNHYLTNAATKLNASNRTSAIIRSITLGVIPIIDI